MIKATIYIATVSRRMRGAFGPLPLGDFATIGPYQDDEPLTVTNELWHQPPVENNIARYRGTFASEGDAYDAIRAAFPEAVITT